MRLWDAISGELKAILTGHTDDVNSVVYSPYGTTLASGSDDNTIRLWDAVSGELRTILTGHTGNVTSIAYSPYDTTLVSVVDGENTISLWDAVSGELRAILTGHTGNVTSIAYSPYDTTLASGSDDNTIRLWDAVSGELKTILTGHTSDVTSIAYSSDGSTLASGSRDGTVLLWDLTPYVSLNVTVKLLPSSGQSPNIGEQLTFSLNIANGENVAGYQATVQFDATALRYVKSSNGGYLPTGAFAVAAIVTENSVTLAATSLTRESTGEGTLATLTFEVVAVKTSNLRLFQVSLVNSDGTRSVPRIESGPVIEIESTQIEEDVNRDGVINIQDLVLVASNFGQTGENVVDVNADGIVNIIDLILVAGAIGNTTASPSATDLDLENAPIREQVEQWLRQARQMNLTDPTFQRGITVLEQLLAYLTPKETVLLPNYPNPFNPETWIPYQLAEPADVSISIYVADGKLVRVLNLGHQPVGIYESRSRAAYWDGRNALGEPVASGIYFYTLTADDFTGTRKMLIRK